jgi:tetratricopeptide (TPR) repeat protein
MKLINKILSHGLLIAFFVAAFFLYLYRVELFPQWFGDGAGDRQVASGTGPADARAIDRQADKPGGTGDEDREPARSGSQPAQATDSAGSTPQASPPVSRPTPEIDGLPPRIDEPTDVAQAQLPPVATESPAQPDEATPKPARQAPTAARQVDETPAAPARSAEIQAEAETAPAGAYRPEPSKPASPPSAWRYPAVQTSTTPQYQPVQQPSARDQTGPHRWAAEQQAARQQAAEQQVARQQVARQQAAEQQAAQQQVARQQAAEQQAARQQAAEQQAARQQAARQQAAQQQAAQQQAVASAKGDNAYIRQLEEARQLYWNNDLQAAAEAYSSLTAAYPQRADSWGELGNLYFNAGRWNDAADAYYRAIDLLIDQREPGRARHMLRVLHGLDAGKASELEQRLDRVGG